MKTTITHSLIIFFLLSFQLFAQTAPCDGTLPFEEQNGILTIEMESGNLPSGSNWQTGSEADPNLSGATIDYIFWSGTQSFNALSGAPIIYNIKINNPGTYRLAWRGRIGTGTSGGEHNDAWLRIVADDFFSTRQSSISSEAIETMPDCNSNPNRGCADDAKVNGYFKAFMNRHPVNSPVDQRWGFVTNTRNNNNAFRFIWATFNTAGNYSIIVDARSSFFFMDKMVLRRSDVSDSNAFNLSNNESSCYDASLSISERSKKSEIKIYPNPANNKINLSNLPPQGTIVIKNIHGAIIKKLKHTATKTTIDISPLQSGVYFISNLDKNNYFTKKVIKL